MMTCPDYRVPCAKRNSHTDELYAKAWPAAVTAGMLGPEAVGRGGPLVIRFRCPKCHADLEFGAAAAGRMVRCPGCRAGLRIPGELTATRPAAGKNAPPAEPEDSTKPGETPEWLAPAIILGIGLVLTIGSMAVSGGTEGAAIGFGTASPTAATTIPLSIAGMFIVAPLLGITFGTIGRADPQARGNQRARREPSSCMAEVAGAGLLGF